MAVLDVYETDEGRGRPMGRETMYANLADLQPETGRKRPVRQEDGKRVDDPIDRRDLSLPLSEDADQ